MTQSNAHEAKLMTEVRRMQSIRLGKQPRNV